MYFEKKGRDLLIGKRVILNLKIEIIGSDAIVSLAVVLGY